MKFTAFILAMFVVLNATISYAQVVLEGTCPAGKGAGFKVNSDFSISLYCFTPPSSGCTATGLKFAVACNSQYAPAVFH